MSFIGIPSTGHAKDREIHWNAQAIVFHRGSDREAMRHVMDLVGIPSPGHDKYNEINLD